MYVPLTHTLLSNVSAHPISIIDHLSLLSYSLLHAVSPQFSSSSQNTVDACCSTLAALCSPHFVVRKSYLFVSKLSTTTPKHQNTAPISSRSFKTHRIPSYISNRYYKLFKYMFQPPSAALDDDEQPPGHSSLDLVGARFRKYSHNQCIT